MNKYTSLEHSGPLFPKEYTYIGFDTKLSSLAEEMLYHYSAKLQTEYAQNKVFNKNFWNDLKPQLPKEYQSKKLEDFLPLCETIFKYIQDKKEEKKSLSKEEKLLIAKEKEELKEKYGYCTLDGVRQPIASFYIESPGILITRGKHPQLGCWKFRITPEDVCINATNYKDIKPPKGHSWKKTSENKNSLFLVYYDFTLSNGRKIHKFIQFSAKSIVKQGSDQKKFEKAKLLIKNWKKIDEHIKKGMQSKDSVILQSATVLYLIKNLGIRVGDEKDSDLADTVGASTLRREHLSLEGNTLKLSFLGKDSVKYENSIELPIEVTKVFTVLLKSNNDMLFPSVTSIDINNYLKEVVPVTAKVFRTAYGSSLLAEGLRAIDKSLTVNEKILEFNSVNLTVAKKLNHQKQVGKNTKEQDLKMKEKFLSLGVAYGDIKKRNEILIDGLVLQIKQLKNKGLSEENKLTLSQVYDKKIEKYKNQIDKAYDKVSDFEMSWKLKTKTSNVALGTSKTNYSDPRIGISWCKDYQVPVEKLYSKTLQEKFSWALECENDYYSKYKLIEDK